MPGTRRLSSRCARVGNLKAWYRFDGSHHLLQVRVHGGLNVVDIDRVTNIDQRRRPIGRDGARLRKRVCHQAHRWQRLDVLDGLCDDVLRRLYLHRPWGAKDHDLPGGARVRGWKGPVERVGTSESTRPRYGQAFVFVDINELCRRDHAR